MSGVINPIPLDTMAWTGTFTIYQFLTQKSLSLPSHRQKRAQLVHVSNDAQIYD